MLWGLIIAAMLSQSPVADAPKRSGQRLTWSLSVGAFMGSVWASPSFRASIDRYRDETFRMLETHGSLLDSDLLVMTAPVVGPWLMIARGQLQSNDDMLLLVASGLLQAVGITTLVYRWLTQSRVIEAVQAQGLELSISPIVANRLGVSVTLTGF